MRYEEEGGKRGGGGEEKVLEVVNRLSGGLKVELRAFC
jgi:hypothetical protein